MMMDAEKAVALKIKRFSGEPVEWPTFKLKFEAVLETSDLLDNLLSTAPEEGADGEAEWKKKNR